MEARQVWALTADTHLLACYCFLSVNHANCSTPGAFVTKAEPAPWASKLGQTRMRCTTSIYSGAALCSLPVHWAQNAVRCKLVYGIRLQAQWLLVAA